MNTGFDTSVQHPAPVIHHADKTGGRLAIGQSPGFEIHEWSGGGGGYMHVHHADDEAWHVISGRLRFRFADRQVEAGPGTTVFVPAGAVHDYDEIEPSRYLMILTPRLRAMIEALHDAPYETHADVMRAFESEIIDGPD